MECQLCFETCNKMYISCKTENENGVFHNCMKNTIFCPSCFFYWIDYSPLSCLYCRKTISLKKHHLYDSFFFVISEDSFEDINCPLKCSWQGQDIQSHWNYSCPLRYFQCSVCFNHFLFKDMENHKRECKKICCPIDGCSFNHVFSLTFNQRKDPYYYPIFFYYHFSIMHKGMCNYVCSYKEVGFFEYCIFKNRDNIPIQRFELN